MQLAAFPGQLGVLGASSGQLVLMGVSAVQLVRSAGQPGALRKVPWAVGSFPRAAGGPGGVLGVDGVHGGVGVSAVVVGQSAGTSI